LKRIKSCTQKSQLALLNRDWLTKQDDTDMAAWAELMNRNFDIRRRLYGDSAVGEINLAMVNTARRCGAGAKLAGSGGAVLVCITGGQQQAAKLMGVIIELFLLCTMELLIVDALETFLGRVSPC
jgi:glucuronokinase